MAAREPDETDLPLDSMHRQVVEALSDGVYFVDRERTIQYWNEGARRISGYEPDDVVGRRCYENILNHVDEDGHVLCFGRCPLAATIEDGEPRQTLIYLRHRDGHRLPVRVRVAAVRDAAGTIVGASEVFSEATAAQDLRHEVDELRRFAFVDELTGLPNRRQVEGILAAHLESLNRHGWAFGILVADIDHFKGINDRHGHIVGDATLKVVGRTIVNASRSEDFVGRWGGDEFVIAVAGADSAGLLAAAERLRVLAARSRVRREGIDVPLSLSIGGTLARAGDTLEELFDRADRALYRAKAKGRDRVELWSGELQAGGARQPHAALQPDPAPDRR